MILADTILDYSFQAALLVALGTVVALVRAWLDKDKPNDPEDRG